MIQIECLLIQFPRFQWPWAELFFMKLIASWKSSLSSLETVNRETCACLCSCECVCILLSMLISWKWRNTCILSYSHLLNSWKTWGVNRILAKCEFYVSGAWGWNYLAWWPLVGSNLLCKYQWQALPLLGTNFSSQDVEPTFTLYLCPIPPQLFSLSGSSGRTSRRIYASHRHSKGLILRALGQTSCSPVSQAHVLL